MIGPTGAMAPMHDPGRGRTKTSQLWAYAREDRPWGGADPRAVAYVYVLNAQPNSRSRIFRLHGRLRPRYFGAGLDVEANPWLCGETGCGGPNL